MERYQKDMVAISRVHKKIHDGDHYRFCSIVESLATGGQLRYILTTPNTLKISHFSFEIFGSLKTKIELYESTTHTTAGVPLTSYNSNRNSNKTAEMTIHIANTDVADGTRIDCLSFGSSTIGVVGGSGGQSREENEWPLKKNTKYLIKVISGSDGNNVTLRLSWYEEKNYNI